MAFSLLNLDMSVGNKGVKLIVPLVSLGFCESCVNGSDNDWCNGLLSLGKEPKQLSLI